MNFLNPTPNIRPLKKTVQGKVAKIHFPGNKIKIPTKSASSWHSFLTLSNEVTQKTGIMSGPTQTPCTPLRLFPLIQHGSIQRHSAPMAGSACNIIGQKSEWHLALSTSNHEEFSKPRPSLFGRPGSWSLPWGRGEKQVSPLSPTLPKVTLQTSSS